MNIKQLEWYILFLDEYIKDIEEENQRNDTINNILNGLKKFNSPVSPWKKWNDIDVKPLDCNTCPKCGLKLEGVMGYCCPNAGCPTGMGPVMCKA